MKNRLKVGLLSALLVLVATASAGAQTTPNPSQTAPNPPPTTPDPLQACPKPPQMTYNEVGEFLTSDCRNGFPDPIQYIPLGHDENYHVSIGFWIRERGEYFSNPNFSDHPSGNAYLMQRYFLHADFHLGERFRFFGELASSLVNGRNGGPRAGLDEEKMCVHQGFFDLGLWKSGDDSLTLRVGREENHLWSRFSHSLSPCRRALGVSALDEVEHSV
jgi:Alginate export